MRSLRVTAHEGSDCVIRYLPDQTGMLLSTASIRELNKIIYGKPLFAVKITFKPGGFYAYCAAVAKLQPGGEGKPNA